MMAEALQYFDDFCANCRVYGWKEPSDESMLLRCSKCRFLSYCSKECQTEHWMKVHKQQCKYLAKEKEMRKSRHDPAYCSGCLKQADVGLADMSKSDNQYLGCPWTMNNVPLVPKPAHSILGGEDVAVPLPFKLGEMTGQWQTKAEHTVFIMRKLLHKMKVTMHPAYTIDPQASSLLTELVNVMRQDIWMAYIHAVPSNLDRTIANEIDPIVLKMLKLVSYINKKLSAHEYQDQTEYRPWDTFSLLLRILFQLRYELMRRDVVRLGLPGIFEEDKQHMVTSHQFNVKWMKVLASIDGILVPYTDLMMILCGGDLHQVCSCCSQDMVVADVEVDAYNYCGVPSIVLQGSFTQAYLCGDLECYKKDAARDNRITAICVKTSFAALDNLCDYCFLVSSGKVHRCTRCLTKYYCGVGCRNDDWEEVHKLVCKGGRRGRQKEGSV